MVYLRVVGAIALLGLLAACDDSQAPTGGPTPLMDVGPTPVVLKQGEVLRDANGNIIARAFTTAEAIEHLERRAAEDPEFLDTPHESHSDDGTTTTVTFREALNNLKRMSQASSAQQSQSAALDFLSDPPPPQIVEAKTTAEDGVVGATVTVAATMDVSPREPPHGLLLCQAVDEYLQYRHRTHRF